MFSFFGQVRREHPHNDAECLLYGPWLRCSLDLLRVSEQCRDAMFLEFSEERTAKLVALEAEIKEIRRRIAELKFPDFDGKKSGP